MSNRNNSTDLTYEILGNNGNNGEKQPWIHDHIPHVERELRILLFALNYYWLGLHMTNMLILLTWIHMACMALAWCTHHSTLLGVSLSSRIKSGYAREKRHWFSHVAFSGDALAHFTKISDLGRYFPFCIIRRSRTASGWGNRSETS